MRTALSKKWGNEILKLPRKILFLLTILILVYLLNCFTALRLTHDTIRYLLMEEWMEKGFSSGANASKDFLPYGYVVMLYVLSNLHLLHSFVIVFINELYLFGALYFVQKIFIGYVQGWQLVIYTLLSWLTIKFSITVLSEMQYLFFSTGALYFYQSYRLRKLYKFLLWACIFFIAAILTRAIGITLLMAVCFSLLIENKQQIGKYLLRNKALTVILAACATAIIYFSRELRLYDYMQFFLSPLSRYGMGLLIYIMRYHLVSWAEIFLNIPSSKITFVPSGLLNAVYIIIGILSLSAVFYLMFGKKIKTPLVVKYYLLTYLLIVFCWPFYESRFWLPIIPLLFSLILQTPAPTTFAARTITFVLRWIYISTGIFVLSYYTYTSLDKRTLAITQDAGRWRNEYETHFFGRPLSDTASKKNEEVIRLLKKID